MGDLRVVVVDQGGKLDLVHLITELGSILELINCFELLLHGFWDVKLHRECLAQLVSALILE